MGLRVVLSLKSEIVAQLTVPGSRSKASRATEYLGHTDSAPQWTQDRAHSKAGPVAATLVGDVLVGRSSAMRIEPSLSILLAMPLR